MAEEIHELHERAHEARENPSLAGATVTMSILAVFVAAVSLLGHRSHTEELLTQSQASDIWAEYQAKSIRRHGYEQIKDLLAAIEQRDTTALQEKYQGEADKARKDQDELKDINTTKDEVVKRNDPEEIKKTRKRIMDLREAFRGHATKLQELDKYVAEGLARPDLTIKDVTELEQLRDDANKAQMAVKAAGTLLQAFPE